MARIQFTEKANLGKKVSESLPKQPRVAESLSKLEEVKAEEQVWKYQVQPVVLYKVAERKWGEVHDHLLQKNSEDDSESNRVSAVKFSPEAVAEALTQCEQETYLIRLITPLQSNTEARLLVKSWHACRKSANLNHLMAHLDDRYEPALIKNGS